MTREEALIKVKGCLTDYFPSENYNEVEDIMVALEQEPCEDAISRADVKKYLSAPDANGDRVIYESNLDLLPSVIPQPKTGSWVKKEIHDGYIVTYREICSNCGISNVSVYKNYCPNCGKKMVEPPKSEVEE